MQYSAKVNKINLPEAGSEVNSGTSVIASGYGVVQQGGSQSSNLRKLNTDVITLDSCNHIYGGRILETNFCTQRKKDYTLCGVKSKNRFLNLSSNKSLNKNIKYFQGDSGGPGATDNKKTLIGVASGAGRPCGDGNPDIFTKVSSYIPYIESEMNGGANDNPAKNYS